MQLYGKTNSSLTRNVTNSGQKESKSTSSLFTMKGGRYENKGKLVMFEVLWWADGVSEGFFEEIGVGFVFGCWLDEIMRNWR